MSLKSSQLNWYDLETKCKKLVFDIVQPQIEHIAGFESKLSEMDLKLKADYLRRLEELETLVLGRKGHTKIDETNSKLEQVETSLKSSIASLQDQLATLTTEDQRLKTHLTKLDIQNTAYHQRFDLLEQ